MHAIVGLGNPGEKYANTFHNAGFWALDALGSAFYAKFSSNSSFNAIIAVCFIENHKVVLAKPTTYMNLSGTAVGALLQFYKISVEDLIVIRDDIDMDLGKIKLKQNSSSGGHKGVQSIIDAIGSKAFIQVKIGVGRQDNVSDFVLKKLSDQEKKILAKSAEIAAEASVQIVTVGFEKAANNYNNKVALDV
ncbi:Peptidyl-tRNA hydrolase [Desulfurella amilsii]|uniref:Peptidyl-tRNA hydrolase n=1 Tax=Desulfurella amilsii TaxID=1562698 RepID=A0A1X4XXZ5_9BACT|nr:aminoacyl-tRNA hydrolase [Desulfurella amilsii]OSS42411.1 Peptidyl-tRNA hydrolase [Desulfurella amilsii]